MLVYAIVPSSVKQLFHLLYLYLTSIHPEVHHQWTAAMEHAAGAGLAVRIRLLGFQFFRRFILFHPSHLLVL